MEDDPVTNNRSLPNFGSGYTHITLGENYCIPTLGSNNGPIDWHSSQWDIDRYRAANPIPSFWPYGTGVE
jgi:hypothetical protein